MLVYLIYWFMHSISGLFSFTLFDLLIIEFICFLLLIGLFAKVIEASSPHKPLTAKQLYSSVFSWFNHICSVLLDLFLRKTLLVTTLELWQWIFWFLFFSAEYLVDVNFYSASRGCHWFLHNWFHIGGQRIFPFGSILGWRFVFASFSCETSKVRTNWSLLLWLQLVFN